MGRLIIRRKEGERFALEFDGARVEIEFARLAGRIITLAIVAPPEVRITRSELESYGRAEVEEERPAPGRPDPVQLDNWRFGGDANIGVPKP